MNRNRTIVILLLCIGAAHAQSAAVKDAMGEVRQWTGSKFLGIPDTRPARAHLMVYTKSGTVWKDRIGGHRFRIASQEFDGGLAMPSVGEVWVHLSGPSRVFEAVVGVDSNDLGYYSHAGRGSLFASVEAGGRELFRSPVLHEGVAGIPVKVDLGGATDFSLKLTAVGKRSPFDQPVWDQADWANARVTLAGGTVVPLATLPIGPLSGPYSADPPFSFRYGDRPSYSLLKTWVLHREVRRIDGARTEHTVTYRDPRSGLVVRCVAVQYSDFPTVEWTLYLKNSGSSPTPIIEDLQALDALFERDAEGEFLLHHAKGSPNSPTDYEPLETPLGPKAHQRIASRGGRPTDPDLCYFNLEWHGRGVIIALGWPGQWAAQFARDEGSAVRVRAGQEQTHFRLLPGEEVRTPLVALQFWEGDWIAAQNTWRRWMVAHNLPRPGGKLPAPQLAGGSGRYTIEMQEANEENQKRYLSRDLDHGIRLDYWWMDAGWYHFKRHWPDTGTWEPDPQRFPRGLAAVSAAAHARGVKTIVWFEPERVTPGSWLDEKHPEWLLGNGTNKLLYLGNPEARQWLLDHVSKLIREQGIDLYRQDFNFEPLALWRANDAPDRQGITEIKHVMGYLAWWDELRRRFPGMLIDTCASGGRRNDLETLRRAVPLWRSDYAYEPTAMQQLTYGIAFWIPYFGTAFNSVDPYIFRSQMTPATAIGLDPESFENGYARLRDLLKQWRKVAGLYYGDYYPLTPYRTENSEWMAWQFNRPETGEGMVQAFRRPDCPFESARFTLRGLQPEASYKVTDLDTSRVTEFAGRDLMANGLLVTIKSRPGAVILTYRRD